MQYTCKELKQISRGALVPNWGIAILAFIIVQCVVSIASMPFQKPLENLYTYQMVQYMKEMGMPEMYLAEFGNPTMPGPVSIIISGLATLIISLISTIVSAGQCKFHLSMLREEKPEIKELFMQFKYRPDRFIVANLLLGLIMIACVIPIIAVAVSLVYFTATLNPIGTLLSALGLFIAYILVLVLILYFQFKYSQIIFLLTDHPEMKVIESFKESSRIMKGNIGSYFYMILSFIPMELLATLTFGVGLLWVAPYMLTVQAAFYMDVTGDFWKRQEEARRLEEEMGPVLSE